MGWRNDYSAVWWSNVYFDRLGIIQWDSGSVTLTQGIFNCSLQNYFEIKIPFFCTLFGKFPFKIILNDSLICPKTNSATHCLTQLFPICLKKIYDNQTAGWLIRQPIVPLSDFNTFTWTTKPIQNIRVVLKHVFGYRKKILLIGIS